MIKKIVMILFTVTLIFSLFGCSETSDKQKENAPFSVQPVPEPVTNEEWKIPYAEFLEDHPEMNAGVMYYPVGEGRFTIKNTNNDEIPELFIISTSGETLIYTYNTKNGEVELLPIADGGTDIVSFNYSGLKFGTNGGFTYENGNYFSYYTPVKNDVYALAISAYAYTQDGSFYFTTYDTTRICNEGFDYRYSTEDENVSEDIYSSYIESIIYKEGEYSTISTKDLYTLSPEVISDILR